MFYALKGPTRPTSEEDPGVPETGFRLLSVYPNPTYVRTNLILELDHPGWVKIEVPDVLGRTVALLADGSVQTGRHTFAWHGRDRASGMYLIRATWTNPQTRSVLQAARTIVLVAR